MSIHKLTGTAAAILLCAAALSALEVDQDELKTAGDGDAVVFINYTGPHARIDSLASIKQIGTGLGTPVGRDISSPASAGTSSRYAVIHAVDPAAAERLDADILLVGGDATVDHIDNLRHIIAAYLSAAYGYSEQDAQTIAVFVTVYNAVYRGKLDYYQSKYKDVVLKNLDAADCGLSQNYREWPGRSQIVIPLFDVSDKSLSTVDTSVISDTEVVKRMQEDDGKNIDSRKEMVDIKEREAEQAAEKAQEAQKQAVEEQKKTDEKRQEAAAAQKEAEEAQKKAEENPDDEEAQQEAAEKQEAAAQKQEELAEQEKKTGEAKQEASEQQAVADRKTSEAQSERKEIAGDQKEVIEKEIAEAAAPAVYGIRLTDEKAGLSSLVKVNASTGEVMKTSPVSYIRNRTMFQAGDSYIAVAGENSGNGAVKLVLLSSDTMEITAESAETVAETSVLVQDGSDYYCVIQDGKNFVLAKYDQTLALRLKSPAAVSANTPVSVTSAGIIVTASNGAVRLLDKATLKEISAGNSSDAK